ncbi:MAG TPA: ATP-binding protein [Polyangiaceae bacterium]|nr:ATP-binding protein [Polyangiaceae bacterium]
MSRASGGEAPILLVDERGPNLAALEEILAPLGQPLVAARTAAEARGRLAAGAFSIALFGAEVPGLEALAAAARPPEREGRGPVPFLVLGDGPEGGPEARRAFALGAADYLTRPAVPEVLRAKVRAFAGLYAAQGPAAGASGARAAGGPGAPPAAAGELAEGVPQQVWAAGPGGELEYVNGELAAYFGRPADEIVALGVARDVHPDDAARHEALWREALAAGRPFESEVRLRRRDGAYRWFLCRARPLSDGRGGVARWAGTNTDVDEVKRAEGLLSFLAGAGAALASSLDVETTLAKLARLALPAYADACLVYMRGEAGGAELRAAAHVDPAREALLREAFERFPLAADADHGYPKVLRTGRSELVTALDEGAVAASARGPEHLAVLRALAVKTYVVVPLAVHGRVVGALELARSSGRPYGPSDLLLAEELARRAATAVGHARLFAVAERERRRAEEASRAKDEFLAMLSHELRTPLNAILGWSRMLASGELDQSRAQRALETIERNAKAQAHLIDDLLDVARIIGGKLRLDVRPLYPVEAVEGAVEAVRPAAEAREVSLSTALDPQAGPVMGDPGRLQQVAWNLLSNAVKFTPKGGRVEVALRRAGAHLELAVEDSGRGIDPALLEHLFVPFWQADPSITRAHGGLGLGLSIVKHLVELHGGAVEAESEGEGRGARFVVRLPLADRRAGRPAPAPPAEGDQRALGPPGELRGRRVLAVDDEPDGLELLVALLEGGGASVAAATSAAEALALVRGGRFDVLVSDIAMPDEDGYALLRKVRALPVEQGGGTPAVALTAFARAEDRRRAFLAGFQAHLPKPVEPAELFAAVVSLVGGGSVRD